MAGLPRRLNYCHSTDTPEAPRRLWFDLRAIAIFASVVAIVACFVAWKWAESQSHDRCLSDLWDKGAPLYVGDQIDEWSSEWPFHNVRRTVSIGLTDQMFTDDDVRLLRRIFPGVEIWHDKPPDEDSLPILIPIQTGPSVKSPED